MYEITGPNVSSYRGPQELAGRPWPQAHALVCPLAKTVLVYGL